MAVNVELPFHKARELMAPYRNNMPINQPLQTIDKTPPDAPNVLVDAVSLGGPVGSKQKPLVRHVLVKDLAKIATRSNSPLPRTGVFERRAPVGLYALFDGQSCAGEPGPMAAEFCARNFHVKLLARLSKIPGDPAEASIEKALRDTFEDLDRELQSCEPEVSDGCGAAVALLVGSRVFTAVLGRCSAVLCEADSQRSAPKALGGKGAVEPWSSREKGKGKCKFSGLPVLQRSLGDRRSRSSKQGRAHGASQPDVRSTTVQGAGSHPFLLLVSSPIAAALSHRQLLDAVPEFQAQPRASCGEIAARALEAYAGAAAASAQCTAIQVCFLPERGGPKGGDDPKGAEAQAAKRARTTNAPGGGTQSRRLRHILVTFQDPAKEVLPSDSQEGRQRSRAEAEALLRSIMKEMRLALKGIKKAPKDSMELISLTTKRFAELAKEHSECETAKKGGLQCGDLGWLSPDDLASVGAGFKEVVMPLSPGDLSDIMVSDRGLHFVQRVA